MQGYESVFITDPDLSEEALAGILDKIKNTVTDQGGEVQQYHLWGRRRLAYLINKKTYGTYHLFYITGGQDMLKSLTQQYRFTEEIIRFQTIRVENIQEESERFLQLIQKSAESENVEQKDGEKTNSADDDKKAARRSEKSAESENASQEPEVISPLEEPVAEEAISNEEEK